MTLPPLAVYWVNVSSPACGGCRGNIWEKEAGTDASLLCKGDTSVRRREVQKRYWYGLTTATHSLLEVRAVEREQSGSKE